MITTNQDLQFDQHQTATKKNKKLQKKTYNHTQTDPKNLQTTSIMNGGQKINQIKNVLELFQKNYGNTINLRKKVSKRIR